MGEETKYCKRCVMPNTRPGLTLDSEGICSACRNYEQRQYVDWKKRWKELEDLCNKYRGINGDCYDCIVPVSGGKDSYFATYMMKEQMNMNPLLVSVEDPFTKTQTGIHNLNNLSDAFSCDILSLKLNRKVARKMIRRAFEKLGSPTWPVDRAIYCVPLRLAIALGIKLVIYGEDTSFQYGGPLTEETPSALQQINNDAVKDVGSLEYWLEEGVTMKDLRPYTYPTKREIEKEKRNSIFLSYFLPWSGYSNMELAKKHGFWTLEDTNEWDREGTAELYDQCDSLGYFVHPQIKYMKFSHGRVTDVCSLWIREGRMTREDAIKLVKEEDWKMDPKAIEDFCDFTGYTRGEFDRILDKWHNRDLFEKVDNKWIPKYHIE